MTHMPSIALSDRQKSLLAFLSLPVEGKGVVPLDPIRIMKGMFVFAQEMPPSLWPAEAKYDFRPYQYGPCSFEIYDDLDLLVASELTTAERAPWKNWSFYAPTAAGACVAQAIAASMNRGAVEFLQAVKTFVVNADFDNLLRAIYAKYPEFAVNSVFKP